MISRFAGIFSNRPRDRMLTEIVVLGGFGDQSDGFKLAA
jgi:hypothetical protein